MQFQGSEKLLKKFLIVVFLALSEAPFNSALCVCVCWPSACVMKLLHTLTSQSAPVLSCAFSSDGELVVSG